MLILAERIAIDHDLKNDPEVQAVCGVHFRGATTDVAKLKRALQWRRRACVEFGERREREIRDLLLRTLPNDLIEIKDRIHRPVADLARRLSGMDIRCSVDPQADVWVAIASSVASGVLADTLASRKDAQSVADFIRRVRRAAIAANEWKEVQKLAIDGLAIDPEVWFGSAEEAMADDISQRANEALRAPGALNPWLTYAQARTAALESNTAPLLAAMENGLIDPEEVETVWRIAWLTDAAQRLCSAEPVLLRFSGLQLDGIRREYARLDAIVMEMRRRAVSARLMLRRAPEGNQNPRMKLRTELALLDACINMQRGHPAIRDVIARAGQALQAIKPCFMMGPLSVAQYLAPDALEFDLIIMDEASQIRPEDAIGAVARGSQLVVVGDDKQLPPTSFFDRLSANADDGDDMNGDGGFVGQNDGSVLALANSSFGGRQDTLRWHYRSRHPELIAFSNHQFYNNELVIFPAPQESDHQLGLTRIFVDDGCAVNGVNDAEARRVAQAAVDHLRSLPSQSLMIVAMNIKQKEHIETHIGNLQMDNGSLGEVLDDNETDARIEPFVVKNLENVQGDERDVVMISMTYGPPQPGVRVPQTFGPINQANGHRRLNVLFTRAKERMSVFTSMRPSDIQAGPGSSLGVQALRDFLWFAETKQLPSGARVTGKPPESPFEEAVARELERARYKVEPQLGVGSYRLDIAVRDPDAPQQFLLGVECDGAMYHSTLCARDRDRLRQEVLENLGWEIERIWSVDWFRDPASEMQRVLKRLDLLRQPPTAERPAAPQNPEEVSEVTKAEPINIEGGFTPRKQIEGLPRELKKALAGRSTPIGRSRRVLTREETRAALIALREKIDVECPDTDPSRGLLRQTLLEELLRKRPLDADEWRAKIPLDLRQATDGEQFKRYGEDVFEIMASANVPSAHLLAG